MPAASVAANQVKIQMKQFDAGEEDESTNSKKICISWKDIHVKPVLPLTKKMADVCLKSCVKIKKKTILNGIHGIVKPGQLLALMGTR